MKAGFKDSPLGLIPVGWEIVKLSELFKVKSGDSLSQSEIIPGHYPVYGGNGITAFNNRYNYSESMLVIGRVGAKCGCIHRTPKLAWITDNALVLSEFLRPIDKIYLEYRLIHMNLNQYANRNAQPVISGKKIYPLKVPLPPLAEQEKIAEILTTVDDKIDLITQQIEAKQELKKGLMQSLLTRGIGHSEFKDSPLGPIPVGWEVVDFKEIFSRVTRKNTEGKNNPLTISAQYGLINQEEFFNKRIAARDLSGYYLLRRGEFAYNKSYSNGYPMGAIKSLHRYSSGVVSTLYICFSIGEQYCSQYYQQYFEAGAFNNQIASIAQEGARNHGLLNVSVVDFFSLKLPLPPLAEQEKIAEILTTVDDKIGILQDKRAAYQELKKGLMQQLLTGKIRVNHLLDEVS
jgi:type I restriction enzyme, S subunit